MSNPEKEKWIEETLNSLDKMGTVQPSEAFSARMLDHIEHKTWKSSGPRPVRFARMLAAAVLVLAIFNGITLTFQSSDTNKGPKDKSSPEETFVQEYGLEPSSYLNLNETE